MIKLGNEVKHLITGFTGIAVARCEYLNGCIQYCVQPQALDKDGKMQDALYIDDRALVAIGEGVKLDARPSDGGPQRGAPAAKPAGML